jgi:hypothetical protein
MSIARWRWRAAGLAVALAAGGIALAVANPAQAAVPDRFGYVLYNGSAVVPAGTFPAGVTVVPGLPGQYQVTFPGVGGKGGIVHVTAINPKAHWCQVEKFGVSGSSEVVVIGCYVPGGVRDKTPFSLVYTRSSGPLAGAGAYGYVDALPTGALVSTYNSAGAANAVGHTGIGRWLVKLPGLATPGPQAGSLQATAVNPGKPARCKVNNWVSGGAGQQVKVWCFDASGAPFDTRFHLSFQYLRGVYGGANPPKLFGYLWNHPPLGPPVTNFNSVTGPGTNTATPAGTGLTLLRYKAIAAAPDDVQVTAFGGKNEFCGLLTAWVRSGGDVVVRDVNCFTNTGTPINTGFFAAYASRA